MNANIRFPIIDLQNSPMAGFQIPTSGARRKNMQSWGFKNHKWLALAYVEQTDY